MGEIALLPPLNRYQIDRHLEHTTKPLKRRKTQGSHGDNYEIDISR